MNKTETINEHFNLPDRDFKQIVICATSVYMGVVLSKMSHIYTLAAHKIL